MTKRSWVATAIPATQPFDTLPGAIGLGIDDAVRDKRSSPVRIVRRVIGRRTGPMTRLGTGGVLVLLASIGLIVVGATDQILPATSAHEAQLRVWLASRAAGIVSLVMLAAQILIGLLLSHPTNKATWRLSKLIFPWHDTLWLFVLGFIGAHVVAIVVDPWAGVGIGGALVPGLSAYRTAPVGLGTLALEALLVTGLTARWTRLLPPGAWLVIHRAGIGVFVLAWMHGLMAGTDSTALLGLYVALALCVVAAASHRYWQLRADSVRGSSSARGPIDGRGTP